MVRKIEYAVSESGIVPAVSQFGGVQSEHKATELVFKIADELWAKLQSLKSSKGGRLVYRIDGYDGEGGEHNSNTADLVQSISYLLEEGLTFAGGNIRAVLVITLIKEDKTEMELYSFPALLKLTNRPFGFKSENESRESMSTLAEIAKTAAEQTEQDRDYVAAAEKRVEGNLAGYIPLNAKLEIIFDGGDSSAKGEIFNTAVANRILEMADYPIEEGFSGIWNYRKWKNGVVELWGQSTFTCTTHIEKGGEVRYTENLPFALFGTIHTYIHPALLAYRVRKAYQLDSTSNELKMFARLEDTEGLLVDERISFLVSIKSRWK